MTLKFIMSTEKHSFLHLRWAPLSIVCYWVIVAVLALLLTDERGVGSGSDKGTGTSDGAAMAGGLGQSANENSVGSGAALQGSQGTTTGQQTQGESGAGGRKADSAEAEEDTPDNNGEARAADTAEDTPDEEGEASAADTEEDTLDEDGTHSASPNSVLLENEISIKSNSLVFTPAEAKSKPPKKPAAQAPKNNGAPQVSEVAEVDNKPPKENKPDSQSTTDKSDAPERAKLKASQAARMEGFFGSGSISGNVMFIVDVSGSMVFKSPEGFKRLELLKRELKKVLEQKLHALEVGKKEEGAFSIITFSQNINYFPKNRRKILSFNSKQDIKNALEFIEQLHALGGTNMGLAWKRGSRLIIKHKITCVFFLTDGEDPGFQANQIHLSNVRINTFSLGKPSPVLEEIAKKHKGKYTEIY